MKATLCAVAISLITITGHARAEPKRPTPCVDTGPAAEAAKPALVDLNHASETELMTLPGVGPSRARAILAFREAHGGFSSVSQLMRIKGFGRATLKRLRPLLTVTPKSSAGNGAKVAVR
jgi:competence protein ComEA